MMAVSKEIPLSRGALSVSSMLQRTNPLICSLDYFLIKLYYFLARDLLSAFRMVCRDFILSVTLSLSPFSNLRSLFYLINR